MLRTLSFSILFIYLLFIYGCRVKEPKSGVSIEDQKVMLKNIADNIILPAYLDLKNTTQALAESVNTFNTTINIDNLIALRDQLKVARLSWQNCNMFDFGSANNLGLASILNIFPVDINVIEVNIENGNFSIDAIASSSARGFQAIEYLIFGVGQTSEELIASFKNENRKQYLKVLADKITDISSQVYTAWDTTGGNYTNTFKTETGNHVGSSISIMLNAVIQSIERKTRDGKIGIPAGLRTLGIPVPENIESLYGGYSVALLNENLKAYSDLFEGITLDNIDSEGILDYLSKISEDDLRSKISSQLSTTIQTAASINEPLQEEVVNHGTAVNNTIAEIQKLLILFKTDMISALGVSINYQDNDGD